MNTETMITELKAVAEKHKNDKLFTFHTNITAMCGDIIPKLEQLAEYEAIGTVEECREARERQREKKVSNRTLLRDLNGNPYTVRGDCPNCGSINLVSTNTDYCNACGQKLDWSDTQ